MRWTIDDGSGDAAIVLETHEVDALRRSLEVILDGDHIWPVEFETRLGVTVDEAVAVRRDLADLPVDGDVALPVTLASLDLLADSLNEVVNGIGLENIADPVGPPTVLADLHAELRQARAALGRRR